MSGGGLSFVGGGEGEFGLEIGVLFGEVLEGGGALAVVAAGAEICLRTPAGMYADAARFFCVGKGCHGDRIVGAGEDADLGSLAFCEWFFGV